jgi:flagellar basal body-associated protein FliL
MKKVMLFSIVVLAVIATAAAILIGVFYGQQEKKPAEGRST